MHHGWTHYIKLQHLGSIQMWWVYYYEDWSSYFISFINMVARGLKIYHVD